MNRQAWYLLLLAGLVLASTGTAQGVDPRLTQAFADWHKRQEAVESVRYRVEGARILIKGSYTNDAGVPLTPAVPPQDVSCNKTLMLLLDFKKNRHRRDTTEEVWRQDRKEISMRANRQAFDGKEFKNWMPREENTDPDVKPGDKVPDVEIVTGNLRFVPFQMNDWPLFLGEGCVPIEGGDLSPGRLRTTPQADDLEVHGDGVHGGTACVVLRTHPLKLGSTTFREFWVDSRRGGAVLRLVYYSDNKPWIDLDMKYQTTEQGSYPDSWVLTNYDPKGKALIVERMHVVERTANVPYEDQDFQIEVKRGMLVTEAKYDVPGNPILKSPPTETRTYREGSLEETVHRYSWLVYTLAVVVAAAVLAYLAWLVLRWKRRRSLTSFHPPTSPSTSG